MDCQTTSSQHSAYSSFLTSLGPNRHHPILPLPSLSLPFLPPLEENLYHQAMASQVESRCSSISAHELLIKYISECAVSQQQQIDASILSPLFPSLPHYVYKLPHGSSSIPHLKRRNREQITQIRGKEMVKFSKQFEAQLVPEWKDAFVDYWQLKKDLKKMQVHCSNQNSLNRTPLENLPQRLISSIKKLTSFGACGRQHETIQVHRKLTGDLYETELLDQFAETDAARDFFARLDLQLNKVNQFYKGKEREFGERGESLRKQMEILLDLKDAMKQQKDRGSLNPDSKEDQSISSSSSFG